jgi:uncharacterized membrane protein
MWRKRLWMYQALSFTFAFLTSLTLFSPINMVAIICSLLIGIGVVLFLFAFPQMMFKPQSRTLTMDEERIRTTIGKKSGTVPWAKIRNIEYTADDIYLIKKNYNAFVIPRRAFSFAQEQTDFIQRAIKMWQAKNKTRSRSN